jgi:hypothetical protein
MTKASVNLWNAAWIGILIVLAFVWSPDSHATDTKPPPKPPVPSQVQGQGQVQKQAQDQSQSQSQTATANNAGNSQAMNVDGDRSFALGQGSQYLVGCGISLNGGGGDPGGAAFLGIQIQTPGCWDQLYIAREEARGNVRTACEMDRLTVAGKRNLKRMKEAGLAVEPCPGSPPAASDVPANPTVVVIQGEPCASKEYVGKAVEQGFKECVSK